MKTIGLLGGMTWESSIEYERIINTEVRRRLGGVHSADLIIRSYDFAAVEALQDAGDWEAAGRLLAADALQLEEAGAEIVLLCTNTMHRVAESIEAAIRVPFLHLTEVVAAAVCSAKIKRVALLGTRFTMEQPFYRQRLEQRGLTVLIPGESDRTVVHDVIYNELAQGQVRQESRRRYLEIIERLLVAGAQGVIAGCTEIENLVRAEDLSCLYFPSTRLHALAAVDAALDDTPSQES